jgi:hypothetical protein
MYITLKINKKYVKNYLYFIKIFSFKRNFFYEVRSESCGGSNLMLVPPKWVTHEYLMSPHVSHA